MEMVIPQLLLMEILVAQKLIVSFLERNSPCKMTMDFVLLITRLIQKKLPEKMMDAYSKEIRDAEVLLILQQEELGYGIKVPGNTEPQPAPFAVVQNATADTFDLYTCDNLPILGELTADAIKNLPESVDSNGTVIDCAGVGNVDVCYWGYGGTSTGYFGGENNPIQPPPLKLTTEVNDDPSVNFGKPTIGKWAARCIAYDSGKVINQPDNARSDYVFNPLIVVNGAPINENYTCGGTIADGGHYCGPNDCDSRFGKWMTEQEMADNVLTKSKIEGSKQTCESYGICNIIKDAEKAVTRSHFGFTSSL